jgi:alkane 1-monooxygenase
MWTTAFATLFLAAFTLLPLHWAQIGAPWVPLVVAFVAIPLIDVVVGAPSPNAEPPRPISLVRWIPRLQLPLQTVLLIGAVDLAPRLAFGELIVFAGAVGAVTGGLGITIAHELAHRRSRLDRAIAKALLISVFYGHFFVEHIRGHHVRVGTPDDPATAPRGMAIYGFLLRSIIGSARHAWRLEAMRLQAGGRSAWHPSNWVLSGSVLSLVLLLVAAWWSGWQGALLYALQAVSAVVLLEIINYIEHYGLRRRQRGGGYEPVHERHSWNADYTVSNWILFNLQFHSDHHAHSDKPFEELRSVREAPQLPAGYPVMVLLALLPPAWFAVMDRRLPAAA